MIRRMNTSLQSFSLFVSIVLLIHSRSSHAFASDKNCRRQRTTEFQRFASIEKKLSLDEKEPTVSENVDGFESSADGLSFSPGEATQRLGASTGPTVWSEFGRIAEEFDPVNLGQGFPDWLPPKFAVDSLVEAVLDSAQSPHQYTRPAGHPSLVNQLARRYSIHMRKEIDPMKEVAVTVGASQALYLSLQTLLKPGKQLA